MKTGGRTASFTREDVIEAGTRIGLVRLSMQSVADALGVTTAALYRHVSSRSELETLVGEAILAELTLVDDPADPPAAHLAGFAMQLRRFTLGHPGTAQYLQRLFPRGPSGLRLLEHQILALGRRGYDPAAAVALSSAMATMAIGATVAEQDRASLLDTPAAEQALAVMAGSELLRQARVGIPEHTAEDYFMFIISAAAEGLVARLPPGHPIPRLAP
ncbi:TetR/AcrR family transcriptional regulator [Nonomuraea gerenzanensis]|uniref:Transcriptional regulator, TetR family n=1 Tax=Nonomuraea gerenzanensis TaxID=93944 RepID=A0A1M4DVU1_9ACTN|nr:TetR/AcrR family transcriptional regulator [Nonomuraea gerenzanensis]UBU13033.1 TetR/AcrR family transcriptional regulator [Nonomuraea gerenzanensis]SBO90675.1 Transcriptional regulator, TetR family [Nonomuraea gerenzanensis]